MFNLNIILDKLLEYNTKATFSLNNAYLHIFLTMCNTTYDSIT